MGPAAVGHALVELDPKLGWVAWSGLAYNYPVVALLFFTGIAKLSPTIFFVKFALTFIEAVNTAVIFRYTNQIWLALLYWASPISIWWVSHEGQFEPLQNLFVLVALLVLKKTKPPGLCPPGAGGSGEVDRDIFCSLLCPGRLAGASAGFAGRLGRVYSGIHAHVISRFLLPRHCPSDVHRLEYDL